MDTEQDGESEKWWADIQQTWNDHYASEGPMPPEGYLDMSHDEIERILKKVKGL